MVSFALSDGLDADALETALGRAVQAGPAVTRDRRYHDTFDGRLFAQDLALAHERGRLVVLDAAGRERAAAAVGARRALLAGDLPDGPVRDLVAPLIEMRALLPLARVKLRRRSFAVLDDEQKTVVRMHVEEPDGLPAQLHLAAVRGYDKEFARACRRLDDTGYTRADESLVAAAIAREGRPPAGVSSKPGVKLEPGEIGGAAAARLCLRLTEIVQANLPGTVADTDTEFLHDLRVAVRRSRALQRELRGVFDPETLPGFRDELKWLQQVTGPTRDLDVNLLDLDALGEGDLDPLRALLVKRRRAERRRMVQALESARTATLLQEWSAALLRLAQGEGGGPDAGTPVSDIAGKRIVKVYDRMVKAGAKIDADSPAEALHDLRKQGKELRYLLEFFGGSAAKPLVASLKALQDTLGRFQDREVQAQLIASLGEEVDGARTLMAMGRLVDRLERQQAAARAEFAERFDAFASKRQRKLVGKVF